MGKSRQRLYRICVSVLLRRIGERDGKGQAQSMDKEQLAGHGELTTPRTRLNKHRTAAQLEDRGESISSASALPRFSRCGAKNGKYREILFISNSFLNRDDLIKFQHPNLYGIRYKHELRMQQEFVVR